MMKRLAPTVNLPSFHSATAALGSIGEFFNFGQSVL